MVEILKRVHLFSGLSNNDLLLISNLCEEVSVEPGDTVAKQATVGDSFFVIANGTIEVVVESKSNYTNLLTLGEGQVFGEMTMLDKGYRSATGNAGTSGCKLLKIENAQLNALFEEYNRIGYVFMRHLAIEMAFKLRRMNLTIDQVVDTE